MMIECLFCFLLHAKLLLVGFRFVLPSSLALSKVAKFFGLYCPAHEYSDERLRKSWPKLACIYLATARHHIGT